MDYYYSLDSCDETDVEKKSGRTETRRSVLRNTGAVVGSLSLAGCNESAKSRRATDEVDGRQQRSPRRAREPTETPDERPGVGIFLGDESKLEAWEQWFGRKVDYFSFALFHDTWVDYRIENWMFETSLQSLLDGREAFVSFEMFPRTTTMQAVVGGEHDDQYRRLAEAMVGNGLAEAHIRFGWEFNGQWARDGAVGRPETYKVAWRRVVDSMRSVDGAEFSFVWAPAMWRRQLDPPKAYPGGEWVDEIGPTCYDKGEQYPYPDDCDAKCVRQRRRKTWNDLVTGRESGFGLDFWAEFAREHDKGFVLPEYGPTVRDGRQPGGGDNPYFFRQMHEWLERNSDVVNWHNLWSWVSGPHFVGPERLKATSEFPAMPRASAEFRRLFGVEDGETSRAVHGPVPSGHDGSTR